MSWPRRAPAVLVLCALGAAVGLSPRPSGARMDRARRIQAMKGVVLLVALQKQGRRLVPVGRGSGTIISADGLILTNNHVISDTRTWAPHDVVAVGLTTSFDQTPRPTCLALPRRAIRSKPLDLAIIKCEAEVNGKPLRRAIRWPAVELGDSSTVVPGDDLYVVGYPSIGGMTITFSAGKTSGFLADDTLGARAWFKTDALISPGVSGGAAFDEDGKLVGVPTQLRWRSGGRTSIGMVRPVARARKLVATTVGRDWDKIPRAAAPTRPAPTSTAAVQLGPVGVTGALAPAVVKRALNATLPAVTSCYHQALARAPGLAGYIQVGLTTFPGAGDHRKLGVDITRTTIRETGLTGCVTRVVRAIELPAARAPTMVRALLIFLAGTAPAATREPPDSPARKVPERLPPPRATRPTTAGSYLTGRVIDAATGQPVKGAVVVVLKPGTSVSSVNRGNLSALTATVGVSTSLGRFRTRTPLAHGKSYAILILASGYRPVGVNRAVTLGRTAGQVVSIGAVRLRRQAR